MEYDILIDDDGTIRFVYSDEIAPVFAGEDQSTRRASHVEPHPTKPGWLADMRPSGGPILFADGECALQGQLIWSAMEPFGTRQAALDAERVWLREHLGI